MTTGSTPFPIIPPDRGDDLHHLDVVDTADLVLFMAGNQFMVMEDLVRAFQSKHPEIRKIFFETLPPGLELKQILAGGAMFRDRLIDVVPDVYASVSRRAMERLQERGLIAEGSARCYLHNRIVLMVPRGNPAEVRSVSDLGREDLRISQPDPENEDIAHHILAMYEQAGGAALVRRIMEEKKAAGTTLMTTVHHRETPQRIAEGSVDVGPVWATEITHARRSGVAVDAVEPGRDLDQRDKINYYVTSLISAPHPEKGDKFVAFLLSPRAREIYEAYGFVPHIPRSKESRGGVP